jgi:hypothetical protein
MADIETRGPGRPSNETLTAQALQGIAGVLEQLRDQAPVKEIGFGDPAYQQRLRDEGFYTELEKPAFQNGRDIEPRGLSPQTIHRLARLAPGFYINKMVEVTVDQRDQRHLRYKSAEIQDRMNQPWRSLGEMVDMIWAEMPTKPA